LVKQYSFVVIHLKFALSLFMFRFSYSNPRIYTDAHIHEYKRTEIFRFWESFKSFILLRHSCIFPLLKPSVGTNSVDLSQGRDHGHR
jgi:hypothetical protein